MILRRVIEHVKAQNWTAVALDFVIVVVGVFIGIQVSNWNAARADRALERHYLVQLRDDLKLIEHEVREQIDFERFQTWVAGEIASELEEPGAQAERRIGVGLAQLTMRRTLRAESPTFADLQSSGNLGVIADPDLRGAIIACFFRTGRFEAAIDKNNQFFVDRGFIDFMRNENMRAYAWDSTLMGEPLPISIAFAARSTDAARTRLQSAGDAVRVLDTPGLEDKIIAQLNWRTTGSSGNENLAIRMLDAVAALDETLAAHIDGPAPDATETTP